MLTFEEFEKIEPGTYFAVGEAVDSPDGVNMTNSGEMLKFVAVKGFCNDWSVYTHFADREIEYLASNGDKIIGRENIMFCVPCDDQVFARYRY